MMPGDKDREPLDPQTISVPEKLRQSSLAEADVSAAQRLGLPLKERAALASQARHAVEHGLQQFAESVPASVMAVMPVKQRFGASPHGLTVGKYLIRLQEAPYRLMTKWRTHLLLVNSAGRILQNDAAAPWGKIKALRLAATKDLPVAELVKMIESSALTLPQMEALGKDIPVLGCALANRPWLTLYHLFPEIGTKEGLRLTPENMAAAQRLVSDQLGGDWQQAKYLQMTETQQVQKRNDGNLYSVHTAMFALLTEEKKPIARRGFIYPRLLTADEIKRSQWRQRRNAAGNCTEPPAEFMRRECKWHCLNIRAAMFSGEKSVTQLTDRYAMRYIVKVCKAR